MHNEVLSQRIRALILSRKYALADHIRDGSVFLISTEDHDPDKLVYHPSKTPDTFIPITVEVIPSLLFLLNDTDRYVRKGIIHTLSNFRKYIKRTLKVLSKRQNKQRLLDKIKQLDEEILETLVNAKETDTDMSIRSYSALTLGLETRKGKAETIDLIKETLKGEKDNDWRFDLNINLLQIAGYNSVAYGNLQRMLESGQLTVRQERTVKRYIELKELYDEREGLSSHHTRFEIVSKKYEEKKKKLDDELWKKGILFRFKI